MNKESNKKPIINIHPNVIDGEELRELFKTVFGQMAYYTARTYGPFGENTGYQNMNRFLTTKDGWTVEQGIIYSQNVIANTIRKYIIDVSNSINIHAGDGTTTGIIAANEINNLLMEYKDEKRIHSKFLSTAIEYCVENICLELKSMATKLNDRNMDDIIYRIAEVSLNWDSEYAGFIRDIYKTTKNPVIRVQDSGYDTSHVEYRHGYDLAGMLVSNFKVNNNGIKKFTVDNPVILIFSYTIGADLFEPLLTVAAYFKETFNQELIVMAPEFEKNFRDAYTSLCTRLPKMGRPLPSMTMVKYYAEYNIEREMLLDFGLLIGASIISRDYDKAEYYIREFGSISKMMPPKLEDFKEYAPEELYEEELAKFNDSIQEKISEFIENINEHIGTCDKFSVDNKTIVASGFNGFENTEIIENRRNAIRSEINKALKNMTAKSMFTDEIKLKMQRLGKLTLHTGIINVGGFGESMLKAKRDALDDAINACANAYNEGVIAGGGIAIPKAIDSLLDKLDSGNWNPKLSKNISNELVKDILSIIQDGFIKTWEIMLRNKYTDGVAQNITIDGCHYDTINVDEIIDTALRAGKPFNLITEKLDDTIIHPVRVETEVVKGCLHLVLTTTTTNQILYNGYDGADKELEGMREVKE